MSNAGSKMIFMILFVSSPQVGEEDVRHANEDIVVLARKILALNIEYSLNGAFLGTCRVNPTSGDTNIDAAACQLVERCVGRGNTIPDNVERCLKATLSDIKSGRSAFKFKAPSAAPLPKPPEILQRADTAGAQVAQIADPSQVSSSDGPNITVIAPTYPKAGRWKFITLTASQSGVRAASIPQSTEQCFVIPNASRILEFMVSSPLGGESRGCHLSGLKMSKGKFSAHRICLNQASRSDVAIDGRYDSKRVDYREDEERVLMSRLPDGGTDQSVVRITTAEYVGNC